MIDKIRCSICGKEFDKEDIVAYDEKSHYAICKECNMALTLETARKAKKREGDTNIIFSYQNDPLREQKINDAKKTNLTNKAHDMWKLISSTSPRLIKDHLDQYIIGQEEAKKTLAVGVYNHYKRLAYAMQTEAARFEGREVNPAFPSELQKSNILMVGPSGTGKTALLKSIADLLDVPFAITDSSCLTENGYVGQDPEVCIKNLWLAAGKDIEKTQMGIIFLDEFDKLARKSETNRMTSADPGHEGVQQALLKIVEGTVVNFQEAAGRRNPDAPGVFIDTTNILFVVGGAYEGIEKIVERRINQSSGFGFESKDTIGIKHESDEIDRFNKLIDNITAEDIKSYGIIPEMVGRLPIICRLHQLKEEDMVRILSEPRNALVKQYSLLFTMENAGLHFDHDALIEIGKRALESKTGARALKTIVENLLLKTMYELPDIVENAPENTRPCIIVTKDAIENHKDFEIKYSKKKSKPKEKKVEQKAENLNVSENDSDEAIPF